MANIFDQFDEVETTTSAVEKPLGPSKAPSNLFDQFDEVEEDTSAVTIQENAQGPQKSYMERVQESFDTGVNKIKDSWNKERPISPNVPEEYRQVFGETAPASMMERLQGAISGGAQAAGAPIAPAIESVVGNEMVQEVAKHTPVGMAVRHHPGAQAAISGVSQLTEKFPDETEQLGNAVEVGTLFGPSAFKPVKNLKGMKGRSNQSRVLSERTRKEQLNEMMVPNEVDAHGTMNQKPGGLKENYYQPSAGEEEMFREVHRVKGVNPNDGFVKNARRLDEEVNKLRDALDNELDKLPNTNVNTQLTELQKRMEALFDDIPTLVGDAETSAQKVLDMYITRAKKYMGKGGSIKVKDLLQARRDLDKALQPILRSSYGTPGYHGTYEAVLGVRREINKIVAELGGDADVLESLRKQAALLRARDIMDSRGWKEGHNIFTRWVQNVERSSGISHPTTPLALGATATNKTGLVASGGAFVAGTAILSKRQIQKQYYKILGAMEEIAKKGGKAAEQIKLDRLALIDFYNSLPQEAEAQ